MSCNVCCKDYNSLRNKETKCPFCDFLSCRACTQTYLLNITIDPHCMNCKKLWSREVIETCCTKSFRATTFKEHREKILFERESCLFPETQDAVVREKKIREYNVKIQSLTLKIEKAKYDLGNFYNERGALKNPTGGVVTVKKEFVKKCPVDDCKGFLSKQWHCELCDNKICPNCSEIKGPDHECIEANVETTALLKKDTKSCPGCGQLIFKISGCAQMWCPSCHVAFNWNTGEIEKGAVHNPHYYEFHPCSRRCPVWRTPKLHGSLWIC